MQHHKYSLTELENMMPWEREIYMGLLAQWVKEENERIEIENPEQNNVLDITDQVKIKLRYPCMADVNNLDDLETTDGMFKVLYRCIDEIHYGDDVYNRVDISDKDIEEFIDQLTGEQFEKVTQFFQTMPKLSHKVSITNPKTNVQSEVVLEGLQSFLG